MLYFRQHSVLLELTDKSNKKQKMRNNAQNNLKKYLSISLKNNNTTQKNRIHWEANMIQ